MKSQTIFPSSVVQKSRYSESSDTQFSVQCTDLKAVLEELSRPEESTFRPLPSVLLQSESPLKLSLRPSDPLSPDSKRESRPASSARDDQRRRALKQLILHLETDALKLLESGALREALELLTRAQQSIHAVYFRQHPQHVYIRYLTADCLARMGEIESAVASAEDALKILQETNSSQGALSQYAPSTKYLLCLLYLSCKKPAKAAFLLEDLSAAGSRVDHLGVRVHLGQAYMALGRFADAVKVLEESARTVPKSQTSRKVHALSQLGLCYLCLNRHESALAVLLECESLLRNFPDVTVHPRRKFRVFTTLGNLLAASGRCIEASDSLNSALSLLDVMGESHSVEGAKVNVALGTVYSSLERYSDSLRALTRARDTFERIQGAKSPEIVPILTKISNVLLTMGDSESAFHYLELALDTEKQTQGECSESALNIWFRLINLHLESGHSAEVIREISTLDSRKQRYSKLGVVMIETEIGNVLRSVGNLPGALSRFLKALKLFEGITGPGSLECSKMHLNIGSLYVSLGRLSEGSAHILYAKKVTEAVCGSASGELEAVYRELSRLYKLQGRHHDSDQCQQRLRQTSYQ